MADYIMKKQQYKTAKELQVEKTISEIRQGLRVLVLMRGLPGSGKSVLAKEILNKGLGSTDYGTFICSTDDYFTDPTTGKYNFNRLKLSEAHHFNQMRAINNMAAGISPVIIDNTNIRAWDMDPYVKAATRYHYLIEIVEPYTKWAFNIQQLALKNKHGVSLASLEHMLERYDKNLTVEKLLGDAAYTGLPLYRIFPPLFQLPYDNSGTNSDLNCSPINPHNTITSPDVICISDDEETGQEDSLQNSSVQGKHNLSTTNLLESEIKKARTYNNFTTKPSTSTRSALEIEKARTFYPQLNLSSWGLSENAVSAWEAWDVVNPIKCNKEIEKQIITVEEANSNSIDIAHAATNTNSTDFSLLSENLNSVQGKVLTAKNRDINIGIPATSYFTSPPKRTLLHKSCMTDDMLCSEETVIQDIDKQISNLSTLFPNIPIEYLRDVYEKCKGDVNWAVDLLLDDTREILPENNTISNDRSITANISDENLPENMEDLKISDSPIKTSSSNRNDSYGSSTALQKHIENIIEIGQDFYSKHILKLKSQKHASLNDSQFPSCTTQHADTSVVISDSESEPDIDYPDDEDDREELIELNLSENVISQLEVKLGFEDVTPQGYLPVVQVPISLARQLYAIYVESVLDQMELQNQVLETIVKQDEDFALKLQEQENENANGKLQALQEILTSQPPKEQGQWKNETADNLATKMTLQKLVTAFPTIKAQTLLEIYQAYNNSYDETVEVLLMSTNRNVVHDPDGKLKEPPITESTIKEMKEADSELHNCMDNQDIAKSAQEYRDEANLHHAKHNELIQKALQAFHSKQFLVAQFYSDRARTHTQLYDQANNLAASAFINENSQKLQSFYTLDLHFLYVKEAIAALDIFIDKNIHLLSNKKPSENLFIITGRGKRSEQGKSKLKPVIMARLRKRKIRYWELNPGLLKIRVLHTSCLTSNL